MLKYFSSIYSNTRSVHCDMLKKWRPRYDSALTTAQPHHTVGFLDTGAVFQIERVEVGHWVCGLRDLISLAENLSVGSSHNITFSLQELCIHHIDYDHIL